ncbi:MAG TPA: hypothetical protein VIK86_05645 [Candidatus Paceibacterota bacterium]
MENVTQFDSIKKKYEESKYDKKNEKTMTQRQTSDYIRLFDTDIITKKIDCIAPLVTILKGYEDKNDVWIKGKIIMELKELIEYMINVTNN